MILNLILFATMKTNDILVKTAWSFVSLYSSTVSSICCCEIALFGEAPTPSITISIPSPCFVAKVQSHHTSVLSNHLRHRTQNLNCIRANVTVYTSNSLLSLDVWERVVTSLDGARMHGPCCHPCTLHKSYQNILTSNSCARTAVKATVTVAEL